MNSPTMRHVRVPPTFATAGALGKNPPEFPKCMAMYVKA